MIREHIEAAEALATKSNKREKQLVAAARHWMEGRWDQTEYDQFDARDVPVSFCKPQSLDDFEIALLQFQSYFGDPTETLTSTLQNDPEFVLGHIFFASALLMMSERQYIPMIREHIEAAEALATKSNKREKQLVAAARHWMEGRWDLASLTWDAILAEYPRDVMALQLGHLTDFYRGDCLNLRDRICRVIGQWDKSIPGYSYVLGMKAFGFEECNQYDKSEAVANAALIIEPRDAWTVHALAHTPSHNAGIPPYWRNTRVM